MVQQTGWQLQYIYSLDIDDFWALIEAFLHLTQQGGTNNKGQPEPVQTEDISVQAFNNTLRQMK